MTDPSLGVPGPGAPGPGQPPAAGPAWPPTTPGQPAAHPPTGPRPPGMPAGHPAGAPPQGPVPPPAGWPAAAPGAVPPGPVPPPNAPRRRSRVWWIVLPLVLLLALCCCGGAGWFAYDEWGEDWYDMRQRRELQESLGVPEGFQLSAVHEQGGSIDTLTASYQVSCDQRENCQSDGTMHMYRWMLTAGVQNITIDVVRKCLRDRGRPDGPGCRWDGARDGWMVTASTAGWTRDAAGAHGLTLELTIGGRA
ncbi:hypothetical protein [Micromonospora sp. NPDC050200]|uniref:hypothetical protein n=1 Tax=Micromonospora sp. NPDC050200 TaxID=3155664 RepID=UPI0033D060B8